jgi:hypothetical protein
MVHVVFLSEVHVAVGFGVILREPEGRVEVSAVEAQPNSGNQGVLAPRRDLL